MPFAGNKRFCCWISSVFFQKLFLYFLLRSIKMVGPAAFGQDKAGHRKIACLLHLHHLPGNGVYFGIGILPELLNLLWTLIGKPRNFGYRKITSLFQEIFPLPQALCKPNIVDSSFGLDQIQRFLFKGKIIHGSNHSLYPVM